MSTISAVNNLIAGTSGYLSQTEQTPEPLATSTSKANSASNNIDTRGPATTVDLSSQAQALSNGQSSSSGTSSIPASSSTSGTSANAPLHTNEATTSSQAHGGGGGGGGVSYNDVSTTVTEAKQKVAAQVGVVDANFLVDSKGNIDEVGLQKDLSIQQQPNTAS